MYEWYSRVNVFMLMFKNGENESHEAADYTKKSCEFSVISKSTLRCVYFCCEQTNTECGSAQLYFL